MERDDAALEDFLSRVHELGQGPPPAPNARLGAVLGVTAPVGVRRIAPRTVAGATALGLAALFGTGWAAAAADQLPGPAQRTVARLTAGWLPGIPHPEEQRSTVRPAAGDDPGPLPTATVPTPTREGSDSTGSGGEEQPVRQQVPRPPSPSGTRRADRDSEDREADDGPVARPGAGDSEDSGTTVRTGGSDDRSDDGDGGGDTTQVGSGGGSGTDDGGTDESRDGGTGSDDEADRTGSGTSSDDGTDH